MRRRFAVTSQRICSAIVVVVAILAIPSWACAMPSPRPDDIRRTAHEVFQRPEFQDSDQPASGSWFLRQIAAFFRWLGGLYDGARGLFWLVLIGCIVLLIIMIALIVFQVRLAFTVGGKRRREDSARAGRLLLSGQCRAAADERAAAGDFTEAVRYLFLALVYRFDERGRVGFHKEYTNREYLDLISDSVRDDLRLLVDVLDNHWYGQRPSRRQQYDECLAVYERLAA
jgi:uncharacterized membrane protein